MKHIFFALCLCISTWSSFGREGHIAELVNSTRHKFIPQSLFTEKVNQISVENISKDVRRYTLLDVDKSTLTYIANAQLPAISINISIDGMLHTMNLLRNKTVADNTIFTYRDALGIHSANYKRGAHYYGIVDGILGSVASFSFFDNDVQGIIATDAGNYNIGRSSTFNTASDEYIIYNDRDLLITNSMTCGTNDATHKAPQLGAMSPVIETVTTNCVKVYIECDHKIYTDFGSNLTNATNYATSLFNNVATLYLNDSIATGISQILVWTVPDPYVGATNTNAALNTFSSAMNTSGFTGDLAHLFSTRSIGGGIAWLNSLCSADYFQTAVSASLSTSITPLPTYSWNSSVITHEMGHNLGSEHTHACVWNGTNTRIDNCGGNAGYPEGSCTSNPPNPVGGGTIMSYCHLVSVGINLNLGFGPQPGALLRNNVNAATCLTPCVNCASDITISGNYSTPLTESNTWIQSTSATTIDNTTGVKLDANDMNGYVLIAPSSTSDYFEAVPSNTAAFFIAQAFDGCDGGQPLKPSLVSATTAFSKSTFEVYPNPAYNQFTLKNSSVLGKNVLVNIFSVDGKKILSTEYMNFNGSELIDVSSIDIGVYFLRVEVNNEISVIKIKKD